MWGTIIVAGFLLAPSDRVPESAALQPAAQQTETVATIQVQGNTATPDEEVRRMADVRVGMPFDAATVDAVAGRLRATRRFDSDGAHCS